MTEGKEREPIDKIRSGRAQGLGLVHIESQSDCRGRPERRDGAGS